MTDPRLTEPRNQRKRQTRDGATKDPMQMAVRDALIGFMAATAQAQAEATKEAQRAGIAHAKASGESYRGRKPATTANSLPPYRTCSARAPTSSRSRRPPT